MGKACNTHGRNEKSNYKFLTGKPEVFGRMMYKERMNIKMDFKEISLGVIWVSSVAGFFEHFKALWGLVWMRLLTPEECVSCKKSGEAK
jgi:hypothetical protein